MMNRLILAKHTDVLVDMLWFSTWPLTEVDLIDVQRVMEREYPFELRELGLHVWCDSPNATHPNFDFCTIHYALINSFPNAGNQIPNLKFLV